MINVNQPSEKKTKKGRIILQTPRGMRDILPEEQPYWFHIDKVLQKSIQDFGFKRIELPIVEFASIFERGIGKGTDIIDKEMYTFHSRGGDRLALRPEMTAGLVRSFIQNGMHVQPKPIKLFSQGPVFRYDRPQEGRYRQLFQANFDIFGEADPIIDAELIQIACSVLFALGIKKILVKINTLGTAEDRKTYQKAFLCYLKNKKTKLCPVCKKRLTTNPLRIFDCKEEKCQQVIVNAPRTVEHLSKETEKEFQTLLEYLDELRVPYEVDTTLVRGLDYYTQTVFEVVSTFSPEDKRLSLCGGGRYDGLVAQMGGTEIPVMGFAFGLDRLVMQMKKEKTKIYEVPTSQVFLAQIGALAKKKSLKLFVELQKHGILTAESFGRGSLSAQLRQASKLKTDVTIILGQKEALDDTVIIKDMTSGSQETVTKEKMIPLIKRILKSANELKK